MALGVPTGARRNVPKPRPDPLAKHKVCPYTEQCLVCRKLKATILANGLECLTKAHFALGHVWARLRR